MAIFLNVCRRLVGWIASFSFAASHAVELEARIKIKIFRHRHMFRFRRFQIALRVIYSLDVPGLRCLALSRCHRRGFQMRIEIGKMFITAAHHRVHACVISLRLQMHELCRALRCEIFIIFSSNRKQRLRYATSLSSLCATHL